MKNQDIIELLRSHGLKASITRIKIYSYLMMNHIHPTMEDIYNELIDEIPTLSKTTIYNVLNLFLEKKLIKNILIEENVVRYDINLENHAHFKCSNCGKIYDLPIKRKVEIDLPEGFEIEEEHIYFIGTCGECKNKLDIN